MKRHMVIGLAIALGTAPSASTCSAQPERGLSRAVCAPASTPPKGSAARKLLEDALRRGVGEKSGKHAAFNFSWVKVSGSWAYVEAAPPAGGSSGHETIFAVLRRKNGLWSVAVRGQAAPNVSRPQVRQRLRTMFPSAPRDIFP